MESLADPWNYIAALINYMSLLVHMDIFGRPRSWYEKKLRIAGSVFFYLILILIPDLGMWENVVMMSLWAGFVMLCTHRFTVLWALLHGFLWNSIGTFSEFLTASLMNLYMDEKMIFSPFCYHMGQVVSNLLLLFIILEIRRIIGRGQRDPDRETGIAIAVLCTFILMISYSVYHIAMGSLRRSDRYICILINALLLFIAFGIVRGVSGRVENTLEIEEKEQEQMKRNREWK